MVFSCIHFEDTHTDDRVKTLPLRANVTALRSGPVARFLPRRKRAAGSLYEGKRLLAAPDS
jgi:hypothetical protein